MTFYITLAPTTTDNVDGDESARVAVQSTDDQLSTDGSGAGLSTDIPGGVIHFIKADGSPGELSVTPGSPIVMRFYDVESGGDPVAVLRQYI